jgi:ABC-type antimicrobial peptide transport system permease subunit
VKQYFKPGENPIGQRFGRPGPNTAADYEIVGVVEDTAYTSVTWKNHAMFFLPITQRPVTTPANHPLEKDTSFYAGALVLQTSRPMDDIQNIAAKTLSGINPNLTIVKFQTFDQQIAGRFTQERMISRLMSLFGALALLLATVGLYGVTSYTVARRTGEIGIRMALGAERSGVVVMVLRSALLQTAIGLALGVPVAYYCVQFVKSQLYEMNSVSPAALAVATVILLAAAFLAGLIPGRRAASIDPAQALRSE